MDVEEEPPRVVVTAAWKRKSSRRRGKPTRQSVVHGYGGLNAGLRRKRTRALRRAKRRRPVRWKPEVRASCLDADAGVVQFRTSARRASHSDTPGPAALPGEGQPEGWGNTRSWSGKYHVRSSSSAVRGLSSAARRERNEKSGGDRVAPAVVPQPKAAISAAADWRLMPVAGSGSRS